MSTEVRLGYKQSEIGVVPEDWHCSMLSEVGITSSGTTPARSQFDRYFRNGQINWVKTLDLNNKKIIKTDEQVTADALDETCLREYPVRTVLVAMYGGFNQIGRTGILGVPACVNQAITAIQCGTQLIPEYLLATLNFRVDHWKTVASSSRKDPNITSQDIRNFRIAYPSIKEQEKISDVLSGIDALISSLDQLVAKKRDIQQAAMQQLLTGQRRLPGFTGEWEVKRFGEVAVCRSERVDPRSAGRQDFCVELEHIEPRSGRLIGQTVADESSSLKTVFKRQDVLFGKLRAYQRKYWLAERDGVCSTEIWALSCDASSLLPEFLYHSVKTEAFIEVASTAYGTHMPRSDWKVVKQFEISLPSCEEQTAIATILSDMDAELAALEARRDKARQIKQGMMQELLTGRIRLV